MCWKILFTLLLAECERWRRQNKKKLYSAESSTNLKLDVFHCARVSHYYTYTRKSHSTSVDWKYYWKFVNVFAWGSFFPFQNCFMQWKIQRMVWKWNGIFWMFLFFFSLGRVIFVGILFWQFVLRVFIGVGNYFWWIYFFFNEMHLLRVFWFVLYCIFYWDFKNEIVT